MDKPQQDSVFWEAFCAFFFIPYVLFCSCLFLGFVYVVVKLAFHFFAWL